MGRSRDSVLDASPGEGLVLIQGARGSGKRTLARSMHTESTRFKRPRVFSCCLGPLIAESFSFAESRRPACSVYAYSHGPMG